MSRARTSAERIAILKRQQAAATDEVEKIRIQAQIEQERNSGAKAHTKELNTQLGLHEKIRDSVEAQYKAQLDAAGEPVKGANGRFQKGDLVAYTVMEKRDGWGTEYKDDIRNGEWEYQAFGPEPETVVVSKGQTITWTNTDSSPHQVTITGAKAQRSSIALKGQTTQLTLADAGIYDYICGLHPAMKGKIEVKE